MPANLRLEIQGPPGIYKLTGGFHGSWCLSYEMQGKQSQKFPPASSFSKIHLGYECNIYFLPQWSIALTTPVRFSSVAISTSTGDYCILAELLLSTICPWPDSTQLAPSTADLPHLGQHSLSWVCGGCHNMVVEFFGIRSNQNKNNKNPSS